MAADPAWGAVGATAAKRQIVSVGRKSARREQKFAMVDKHDPSVDKAFQTMIPIINGYAEKLLGRLAHLDRSNETAFQVELYDTLQFHLFAKRVIDAGPRAQEALTQILTMIHTKKLENPVKLENFSPNFTAIGRVEEDLKSFKQGVQCDAEAISIIESDPGKANLFQKEIAYIRAQIDAASKKIAELDALILHYKTMPIDPRNIPAHVEYLAKLDVEIDTFKDKFIASLTGFGKFFEETFNSITNEIVKKYA